MRINSLIDRGEISRAKELMSELATVKNRSPEELWQRARLESDGTQLFELLSAALESESYPRAKEKLYLNLARYYQAAAHLRKLKNITERYHREFPRGQFHDQIRQIEGYLAELGGDKSGAKAIQRQLMRTSASSDIRELAHLNLARLEIASASSGARARRELAKLSTARGSEAAPLALYLLAVHDAENKNFDRAALNFNILREAFPYTVGGYDLIDLISGYDTESSVSSGQAEKLLGSFYSVQVGVFTKKSNAKRQKTRFESYGEKVEMPRKVISGKRYYAVYVGRFTTAESALAFKKSLERSERELYSIVLREK